MELSKSEEALLRRLQRNLSGSAEYARVTCILMLGKGHAPAVVADCLGVEVSTVYRYRAAYLHGGADELLENRYKGYWGELDSGRSAALRRELKSRVYTEAKSVRAWIQTTLGVRYSLSGVVDLLNRPGFTCKKTTEVPCEGSQAAFADKLTDLFAALPADAVVYYADGVHPTHNSRSTYEILQILDLSLLDKTPLRDLFDKSNFNHFNEPPGSSEPTLFEF